MIDYILQRLTIDDSHKLIIDDRTHRGWMKDSYNYPLIPPFNLGCKSEPGPGQSLYLLSELDDQWELIGFDKAQEVLFGELTIKCVAAFVELKHTSYIFYKTKELTDAEVLIFYNICIWQFQ